MNHLHKTYTLVNRSRKSEKGAAFAELALTLPFLLSLLFAAIEFGRAFKINEQLVFVSRVAAQDTWRRCSDEAILKELNDPVKPKKALLNTCLEDVARTSQQEAGTVLEGVRVIVSFYQDPKGPGKGDPLARESMRAFGPYGQYDPTVQNGMFNTKYDAAVVTQKFSSVFNHVTIMAIAEVHLPFENSFSGIARLQKGFQILWEDQYEVSVF